MGSLAKEFDMKNRSPVIWIGLILLCIFTLTACDAFATATPQPLPTIVLDNNNQTPSATSGAASLAQVGGVTASGIVMPVQTANLALTQGGKVKAVNVAVGDQVKAGQVLVELDTTEIQIEVNQAKRHFQELISPAAVAAAELAVANAQQAVIDTQKKVVGLKWPRASDTLIQKTEAKIDLARDALTNATDNFRRVQDLPDGDRRKAVAQLAMTNAQLDLNTLIANVNWYQGKPSDIDVALANGNLDAAKAALKEAQWYLAVLTGQPVPNTATGSKLVELETAIENQITAQRKLDDARLVTYIPGTVIAVYVVPGEIVSPGKVLIDIVDDSRLHVETTDLSERDVPKIEIGQPVQVLLKPLNQTVAGRVTRISPLADTLGGDVVYKTTVDLDSPPSGLRAGMSVEVQFGMAQ
jgi:HlyD family secretion protein